MQMLQLYDTRSRVYDLRKTKWLSTWYVRHIYMFISVQVLNFTQSWALRHSYRHRSWVARVPSLLISSWRIDWGRSTTLCCKLPKSRGRFCCWLLLQQRWFRLFGLYASIVLRTVIDSMYVALTVSKGDGISTNTSYIQGWRLMARWLVLLLPRP